MQSMDTSSSMPMPSSTMSAMSSMPTPTPSSMSGMEMPMSQMAMVFFTAHTTPLFSTAWTPASVGSYAGTCIFLIVLSFALRCLYAVKSALESRWRRQNLRRRYIVTGTGEPVRGSSAASDADSDAGSGDGGVSALEKGNREKASRAGVLTVNGLREDVRLVEASEVRAARVQPWRLAVDLPRACLVTVMVGVGYLL